MQRCTRSSVALDLTVTGTFWICSGTQDWHAAEDAEWDRILVEVLAPDPRLVEFRQRHLAALDQKLSAWDRARMARETRDVLADVFGRASTNWQVAREIPSPRKPETSLSASAAGQRLKTAERITPEVIAQAGLTGRQVRTILHTRLFRAAQKSSIAARAQALRSAFRERHPMLPKPPRPRSSSRRRGGDAGSRQFAFTQQGGSQGEALQMHDSDAVLLGLP